jgi:fimbrial chaperone protein
MNVQVRVFRWTQVDGVDRLDPTDDVVASPPIAPLAAQSQRIIRVVRTADAAATEQCYRLLVDELPPPPSADVHRVQLLLRHSIPLFFDSAAGGVAKVGWSIKTSDQGVLLTGQNTGGRHIRVSNIKLLDSTGATVTERAGLIGYVLAGATVTWVLPKASGGHGDAVRLHADGDLGPIDVPLQSAP